MAERSFQLLSNQKHGLNFEVDKMVTPPRVPVPRIKKILKPYVLKIHFTNFFVHAQVIHSPTGTVAVAASTQEKSLGKIMGKTPDVDAAAKIGKILGERLMMNKIPAVQVVLRKEQKYHGRIKAIIDHMRDAGVKLQ